MKRFLSLALFLLLFTSPLYGGGNDEYTVFLTHCNGADTSTTFTDVSTGGTDSPHDITAEATAQVDTEYKEFGTGSFLGDGDSDYLSVLDSDDWNYGTGDFTIDFWLRLNVIDTEQFLVTQRSAGTDLVYFYVNTANRLMMFGAAGGVTKFEYYTAIDVVSATTWQHIVFERNGTGGLIFVDGTSLALTEETAFGTNDTGDRAAELQIGAILGGVPIDGHMDEIRISKGIARWTSDFSVPTEEYSADVVVAAVSAAILSYPYIRDANSLGGIQMINQGMIN